MNCAGCGNPLTGRQKRWCSEDCQKAGARAVRLRAIFDISPTEYDLILAEQGGMCAVCEKPMTDKFFPVDHSHKTGLVRGIICPFVTCGS